MTCILSLDINDINKSLMVEWLEQASQWHEMYCHVLEIMSSNPSRVELALHSIWLKQYFISCHMKRDWVELRCYVLVFSGIDFYLKPYLN